MCLVARHVVRQDVATLCLQHGGEHDAVEHDIVFSDEVYQTRFGVFPPFLPCVGQQLFGVADVADRGVEPYIEHFALGALYGNGNTPIQVAAHGTRLQAHVEPALALAINIGTPLLMVLISRM